MRWVQTVLRGAASPADNDWLLIAVEAVAEGKEQRAGVLVLVEKPGAVARNKALESGVFAFVHAPAPLTTQGVEADLKGLGKDHGIVGGEAGLKEET